MESTKDEIAMTIKSAFQNMGCTVTQSGDYPGWQQNPNSDILSIMEKLYNELFDEDHQVKASKKTFYRNLPQILFML